ncbi:TMEM175 family protein [Streptacidiphilus sp. N1-12]|uniref:TMEM175 family protein n=2 Tax=Streptacidiphilus alkalitolerans TaxID=3342712 RepID=A0ABV6X5L2_9ACTN
MSRLNDSNRVEAFSDGVFAIAITLLILEVKVPEGGGIGHQLLSHWSSYAAYVVTFLIIGIMWANHHTVFGYVARVDRVLVFLNLLLLMVCSALPWAAGLVANYLDGAASGEAAVALAVYSGFMVAHSLTFGALWWWLTRTGHLFDTRVDVEAARQTRLRFAVGSVIYPILVGLSFVSAPLTLAVHGVVAVYYGFNQLPVPLHEGVDPDEPLVA